MDKRKALIVSLIMLLIGAVWLVEGVHALGSGSRAEGGDNVIVLQKADSGREVQVRSGDIVQIELSGAGGTGYWWYATRLDAQYVELVSEETSPSGDKKLMGGPVKGIWRLKAKAPGKTEVVMKYYRVWEGPEKAAEQFSVILSITQ